MTASDELCRWHDQLNEIRNRLLEMPIKGISPDTIFALGQAVGIIEKVKGLLGRDIDDLDREK